MSSAGLHIRLDYCRCNEDVTPNSNHLSGILSVHSYDRDTWRYHKFPFKKEDDCFAILNPKVKIVLDVTLVHTSVHERCVCMRVI